MRAAIYTRVSTEGQEDNTSLADQLDRCRAYAQTNELNVAAELQDIASGATLDRPGLNKLRELIRAGLIDTVIVAYQDRLSRSLAHHLLLRDERKQHGVTLHYADRGKAGDTAEGELFDNIGSSFTEYERLRIVTRLQNGQRAKVADGAILGTGPTATYGYAYEGQGKEKKLVIVDDEAAIMRDIFRWRDEGLSAREITKRLTEARIPTPNDSGHGKAKRERGPGEWNRATIGRMLRNPTYAGEMPHYRWDHKGGKHAPVKTRPKAEWVLVPVPAIVDRALFDRVQAKLDTARLLSTRNAKNFYLLRRMIKCECGYSCTGKARSVNDRWPRRYYQCLGRRSEHNAIIHACDMPTVHADLIERKIWVWLTEELEPAKLVEGIEIRRRDSTTKRARIQAEIDELSRQRARLELEYDKMIAAYKADVLSMDELRADKARSDADRQSIDAEVQRLDQRLRDAGPSDAELAELMAYATELHEEMAYLTDERKRRFLDAVELHIVIERDAAGIWAHTTCTIASERLLLHSVTRSC
jgi:site-specific DNA recombinase